MKEIKEVSILIDYIEHLESNNPDKAERIAEIFNLFIFQLNQAERKHPNWTNDPIHAVSIMNEESGEATKAAIDFYHRIKLHALAKAELKNELSQTGAMVIRSLLHLDNYQQSTN